MEDGTAPGPLPALPQHGAPLRRQALKSVEVFAHRALLLRRQRAESLQSLAQQGTPLRRQRAPLLKALDSSPLFRNSEFAGPVGRNGEFETFRIKTLRRKLQ